MSFRTDIEGGEGVFGISGYVIFEGGILGLDPVNNGISGPEQLWDLGFDIFKNGILGFYPKIFGILGLIKGWDLGFGG